MARKPQQPTVEDLKELAELIDDASSLLERTKVMYEQYFLGIQKLPPAQLHRDIERRIRELTQRQIRNTAARYRLANLSQKFGSYNTYWRRTLREIEQGRYMRDVARVQRRAQRTGQDVPDEILATMPKRMRDRVLRDRELLAKRTARAEGAEGDARGPAADAPAPGGNAVREQKPHAYRLDDDLGVDLDELFRNLTSDAEVAVASSTPPPSAATPPVPPPRSTTPRAGTPPPVPPPRSTIPHAGTPRAGTPPPVPPPRTSTPRAGTPPPVPPPRARPAGAIAGDKKPGLPPGMTEAKTRALYERYLKARAETGKSTEVRYDDLVRSLNQQAPALMKKHNAAGVEFDVQVKGDKVVLKAKPKR